MYQSLFYSNVRTKTAHVGGFCHGTLKCVSFESSRGDRRVHAPFDEKNAVQQGNEAVQPIYTAYFVSDIPALLTHFPPKHEKTYAHHATIAFKPHDLSGISIGKEVALRVVGRVFDEKGDVLLMEGGQTQQKHLHITLSCADGVPPFYSNELIERALTEGSVERIEPPIQVQTVEGYFDGKDVTQVR